MIKRNKEDEALAEIYLDDVLQKHRDFCPLNIQHTSLSLPSCLCVKVRDDGYGSGGGNWSNFPTTLVERPSPSLHPPSQTHSLASTE